MFSYILFGLLLTLIAIIPSFILENDDNQDLPGLGGALFLETFYFLLPITLSYFLFGFEE